MVILNYIYAVPLYAKFANFDIAQFIGLYKYLFAMVVPFNVLQGLIFAVAFALIYAPLKSILVKVINMKHKSHTLYLCFFCLIVICCSRLHG